MRRLMGCNVADAEKSGCRLGFLFFDAETDTESETFIRTSQEFKKEICENSK